MFKQWQDQQGEGEALTGFSGQYAATDSGYHGVGIGIFITEILTGQKRSAFCARAKSRACRYCEGSVFHSRPARNTLRPAVSGNTCRPVGEISVTIVLLVQIR